MKYYCDTCEMGGHSNKDHMLWELKLGRKKN